MTDDDSDAIWPAMRRAAAGSGADPHAPGGRHSLVSKAFLRTLAELEQACSRLRGGMVRDAASSSVPPTGLEATGGWCEPLADLGNATLPGAAVIPCGGPEDAHHGGGSTFA